MTRNEMARKLYCASVQGDSMVNDLLWSRHLNNGVWLCAADAALAEIRKSVSEAYTEGYDSGFLRGQSVGHIRSHASADEIRVQFRDSDVRAKWEGETK